MAASTADFCRHAMLTLQGLTSFHSSQVVFMGFMIGALCSGIISDFIGRKKVIAIYQKYIAACNYALII